MTYHYYDYVDEPTCYKNTDGTPKTSRKLKLLKHAPVPVGEFIKTYSTKLQFHVYHRNYIRHMTRARLEREGFGAGDISLIMDYSEKLNKCRRGAIQTEHWDNTAMTIEVAVCEAIRPTLDAEVRSIASRAPLPVPYTCLFSTLPLCCCHNCTGRGGGRAGLRNGL